MDQNCEGRASQLGMAPVWLHPALVARVAQRMADDRAAGYSAAAIRERAVHNLIACAPALPMSHIDEAIAVALWVAEGAMANGTRSM